MKTTEGDLQDAVADAQHGRHLLEYATPAPRRFRLRVPWRALYRIWSVVLAAVIWFVGYAMLAWVVSAFHVRWEVAPVKPPVLRGITESATIDAICSAMSAQRPLRPDEQKQMRRWLETAGREPCGIKSPPTLASVRFTGLTADGRKLYSLDEGQIEVYDLGLVFRPANQRWSWKLSDPPRSVVGELVIPGYGPQGGAANVHYDRKHVPHLSLEDWRLPAVGVSRWALILLLLSALTGPIVGLAILVAAFSRSRTRFNWVAMILIPLWAVVLLSAYVSAVLTRQRAWDLLDAGQGQPALNWAPNPPMMSLPFIAALILLHAVMAAVALPSRRAGAAGAPQSPA